MRLDLRELKKLKNEYIEKQRKRHDSAVIDAAAHLLLEIGDPSAMLRVAVDFFARRLEPCRIDAGLGSPRRATLTPDVDWRSSQSDAPSTLGLPLPNHDPVVQRVWRSPAPVPYHDCRHPMLSSMADAFDSLRTRSLMAHRLEHQGEPLGMICIDQTTHSRRWRPEEQQAFGGFCSEFLSPLLARSLHAGVPDERPPSAAELAAIRLAAAGLSYKEIAKQLGKSIRTVEHQLRSARQKMQASNQAELVRKCEPWI